MFSSEVYLVFVPEVEIVNAADQGFQSFFFAEGSCEGGDESGFPSALDAIEAYEEGFCGVEVGGEAREDEGDTMGGFVVYDFGFKGCGGERSIGGGYRSHFERIIRPLR